MADNDLTAAWALQAAHEELVTNLQAESGPLPTAAILDGAPFDVGHIVRDRLTGLEGVVLHVSRQDLVRSTPGPGSGDRGPGRAR